MNNIVMFPIGDIRPYPNNPRVNKEAVDKVAASLKAFGWRQPIVVDADHVIIVGHTRLQAAKRLRMKEVPVLVADDLSEEQVKAYRLADNKTAEFSQWDMGKLAEELIDITEIDMDEFGFDLSAMLGDEDSEEVYQDEYDEEPPEEPRTKYGDVWKLGEHILICGDSTNADTISKLMGGDKAKLLFTSPPYSNMRTYKGGKDLSVENIAGFIDASVDFADYLCVNLGIQRKKNAIVRYWDTYIDRAEGLGLKLLAWNVWDKMTCGGIGAQKAFVPIRHEWIFVFGKDVKDLNLTWEKRKSSIYANGKQRRVRQADGSFKSSSKGVTSNAFKKMESVVKIPDKETLDSVTEQFPEHGKIINEHPATFPVYLPAEYIIAFTDKGDVVLEPFGGSGTTLIACEQLGRKCRICELDEGYCDVIINRWETMTGEEAVLLNEKEGDD